MTARPIRRATEEDRLRILAGRQEKRRLVAPWVIVALIAVGGFLGLGFARTSLDNAAFELDKLEKAIAEQAAMNQQLRLDIARLESPARIAPLAEELGMLAPAFTNQILVDLTPEGPRLAEAGSTEETQ